MSIEFYIFTEKSDPPDYATLQNALLTEGWHTLVVDPENMKERLNRPLGGDMIYGCREPETASRVRSLLADGNEAGLSELFEGLKVGGCGLATSLDFNVVEEYGDDWSENFPPKVAERVRNAKSHYSIRTAAGRGDLAYELQVDVWMTLGRLVDGILEDPQNGEYFRLGPEGKEVLSEPDIEAGAPQDLLKSFFDAAKAAGFPVGVSKHGEADLKSDTLSPIDLERLLQFTRNHFPPEDPTGPAMIQMILEDYPQKKGKTFAIDNPAWLKSMQTKYGAF